jgi:hypothetical protein
MKTCSPAYQTPEQFEIYDMPLVRIDLNKNAPVERIRIASEAVYKAMIEVANVRYMTSFSGDQARAG